MGPKAFEQLCNKFINAQQKANEYYSEILIEVQKQGKLEEPGIMDTILSVSEPSSWVNDVNKILNNK